MQNKYLETGELGGQDTIEAGGFVWLEPFVWTFHFWLVSDNRVSMFETRSCAKLIVNSITYNVIFTCVLENMKKGFDMSPIQQATSVHQACILR